MNNLFKSNSRFDVLNDEKKEPKKEMPRQRDSSFKKTAKMEEIKTTEIKTNGFSEKNSIKLDVVLPIDNTWSKFWEPPPPPDANAHLVEPLEFIDNTYPAVGPGVNVNAGSPFILFSILICVTEYVPAMFKNLFHTIYKIITF